MKRFAAIICLFAMALTLGLPLDASASRWVTKEVRWRISSVGSPTDPTAIYVRDTLRTSLGPVDTTAAFSLDYALPMPRGVLAPGVVGQVAGNVNVNTQNDTTVIAYLVIQADSSTTFTAPALTSVTVQFDGRLGSFGANTVLSAGWVRADSALANGAVGGGMILADQTVAVPIRTMTPYGSIFRFGELRARVTGTGGAFTLPAARVFLRYWTDAKDDDAIR